MVRAFGHSVGCWAPKGPWWQATLPGWRRGGAGVMLPGPSGAVVPSLEVLNPLCPPHRSHESVGLGLGPSISVLAATEATVPGLNRREWGESGGRCGWEGGAGVGEEWMGGREREGEGGLQATDRALSPALSSLPTSTTKTGRWHASGATAPSRAQVSALDSGASAGHQALDLSLGRHGRVTRSRHGHRAVGSAVLDGLSRSPSSIRP